MPVAVGRTSCQSSTAWALKRTALNTANATQRGQWVIPMRNASFTSTLAPAGTG